MIRAFLALAACHHPDDPPPKPDFTRLAEDGGFTVAEGAFRTIDVEGCCVPGASCLWNNPSTPYQVYVLPPSPGEASTGGDGLISSWHLRPDEALVWLGTSPPESKYFSWRSYLTYRTVGATVAPVLGSLGPSLNDLVVADTQGADHVFGEPMAVVTTADAAVEGRVVDWLVQAGWDRAHIHPDRLPYALLHMGLDPDDDQFSVVSRTAVFADPAAEEAWRADPGATVLRLTPTGPPTEPAQPWPVQPLPAMGSGTDEEAWRGAVDRLGEAIAAAYPTLFPIEAESNDWFFETYSCLADNYCSGEIRDRYYARVPSLTLPGDGSFAIAFGVNHERTGKASYANVSVETVENQIGLDTVESDRFVGSARAFLPDDPQVDDLYAVAIARDCGPFGSIPCIAVPEACPGVPLEDPLIIDYRAYLEPATGAAPLATELLPDRAIKFFVSAPVPP
jgi:hypothetical protein